MDWYRQYAEFAHDPKVQSMSEKMQRRLVMIFCLRCSNDLVTLHETDISFALRISDEDLAETKSLFVSKGFIDDNWNILHWDKRQMRSDSSLERVKRYRERQRNGDVTLQKRECNGLDKIREERKEKNNKKEKPDESFVAPEWIPASPWQEWLRIRKKGSNTPYALRLAVKKIEELANQGFPPSEVLENCILNKWQGVFPPTRAHNPVHPRGYSPMPSPAGG